MSDVPFLHNCLLALVVVCSVVLGIAHILRAQEISEIFLAATGASLGNAVGHQVVAEKQSKRENGLTNHGP